MILYNIPFLRAPPEYIGLSFSLQIKALVKLFPHVQFQLDNKLNSLHSLDLCINASRKDCFLFGHQRRENSNTFYHLVLEEKKPNLQTTGLCVSRAVVSPPTRFFKVRFFLLQLLSSIK